MTPPKNPPLLKTAGLFGILIPVIAFGFIFSAIASYPTFDWTTNALSDLGVVAGLTSELFNVGLAVTGVLALVFAVGLLATFSGNRVGQASVVVFGLACIALIAIGVFNESFSPTHYLVSVAFFVFLPISLFIMTVAFGLAHKTKMAVFTIAIALAAVLPWALFFTLNYAPNVALPEFVSGLAGSVWTVVVGYQIVKAATAKIATA